MVRQANACSPNLRGVTALAPREPVTGHDAPRPGRAPLAVQQSFDALGTPLAEVTFVVLDLETTGTSPSECAITEVGAVRYRGGERVGVFQTLVNPGVPIPPFVARLTGISDRTVAGAPTIGEVLPSFVSFARGAVIVAHNAAFDVGFLDAALDAHDLPLLPAPAVCTARLARRVVWPDVPNVKLRTLAEYFRTPTQPRHRASRITSGVVANVTSAATRPTSR